MRWRGATGVAAALVAGLAMLGFAPAAGAAIFTVNMSGDAGDGTCGTQCTVRDAVETAAQSGTRDTIRVPAGLFQLTQGPLQPAGDVVAGAGARATTIRSDGTAHVFFVTTGNNEVSGVTLTNGGGQNQAGTGGGAAHVTSASLPASLTLRGVTVAGNHAAVGGGLANNDATLTVIDSTISGNAATSGGGSPSGGAIAASGGTTRVVNSTLSGNIALNTDGSTEFGGALYGDDATFELRNVTIAGNSAATAPSLYLDGTSTASLFSTIVSDGAAVAGCAGNAPTGDHSIADDPSCGVPVTNPQIGALAANGGPTNTHALAVTSPARDRGAGCSTADQRGVPRDGVCDIGAFEYFRPRLTVATQVANDQGGTKAPGDFSVHVRSGQTDVAGSPAPGTATGRTYVLAPGSYTVAEDADDFYSAALSGGCSAAGVVTLAESQIKTCTVTNSDKPPVAGKVINAEPGRGTVKIKLPGRRRFRRLTEGQQLPVGTIVDTLRGRVTLFAAGGAHADFYAGIFKLSQTKKAKPLTTLTLVEKLRGCKARGTKATTAKKKKRKRRLWGNGTGRFRTKGKHSAATVVGTKWLVEDRCSSTLTRVRRGKVKVRDFAKHKTVTVKAGKRYIARERR